jgi:PAS domain S-box-containing protein
MTNDRFLKNGRSDQELFDLITEVTQDGLWDWDIANDTVFFSSKWKSMLGYSDDEIENNFNEWLKRIHPEDVEATMENVTNYLNGTIEQFENIHRLQHKDGHWIWVLDRGKANFVDGKAVRVVGFHTDITQQKDLEYQLELKVQSEIEKNKQKDDMLKQQSGLAQMGEMISMIAHQWRQPLASIASIAVTIKIKIALSKFDVSHPEGIIDFMNYINTEIGDIENLVQMLTTTIDDFRNFYKPDKEVSFITIDLPIKKVLSILKPQIEQENIEITLEYLSQKEHDIYENEMLQVFLNIIKNSLDNFKEKNIENPKIHIKTEDIFGKVIVSICDNGGGISEDIVDFIFDPYFSTKDNKNGTGLGLYMSKTIIEQHHKGKLSVQNKSDGVCFHIILDKQ